MVYQYLSRSLLIVQKSRAQEKWHIRAGKGIHGFGQGSCDRIYCSRGSAIFLCNDLDIPLDLPYGWLAE